MYVGVDYYPEHWAEERWRVDIALMREAGFNLVRLAEFTWYRLEPSEGRFETQWLSELVDLFADNDIAVVPGTPTAIVPSWAAQKYPEVMSTGRDGRRTVYGVRKDNCYHSGKFNALSDRIVERMTASLGEHPNVVGWQIDNEFAGPRCYCLHCLAAFRQWLQDRYGTVAALNKAWGLHFWSHDINDWEEIRFPDEAWSCNPSQYLDHRRFHSDVNVSYQRRQIEVVRKNSPGRFVTHNFMGFAPELNYFDLSEDLDFVSWDNYPNFGDVRRTIRSDGNLDLKPRVRASAAADLMRGTKGRNFWIMEQTAGPTGWGEFGRNVWPGELRNIAYQQVAHGCDGMVWFRWRTCTAGREQYWHGLLGHDGKPGRRYAEARTTALELTGVGSRLVDSDVPAEVAIIFDYDSRWALEAQPAYCNSDYVQSALRYYEGFYRRGINVHFISSRDDLSEYRLVVASHLYILPDETAVRLNEFVKAGGVLLADCRTGVKDDTSLCHARTLPGLLTESLGIAIEEYESLEDSFVYDVQDTHGSQAYTACLYSDWIRCEAAEPLYKYTTPHVSEFAVLTSNGYGDGEAFYLGTIIKEIAFYDELAATLLQAARLPVPKVVPDGVQVRTRCTDKHLYTFYLNHLNREVAVDLNHGRDIITDQAVGRTATLSPMGVVIVQSERKRKGDGDSE